MGPGLGAPSNGGIFSGGAILPGRGARALEVGVNAGKWGWGGWRERDTEETPLATLALADAFAGSTATGKRVASLCAEQVKKCHLELGGNDPFIVCSDAQLDVAVPAACWAAFLNAGQVCTSGKRFYVFEELADEFLGRAVAFTRSLRLGDGMDPRTDVGPLISRRQLEDVEARVDEARRRGPRTVRRSPASPAEEGVLLRADRDDGCDARDAPGGERDLRTGDADHARPGPGRGDRPGQRQGSVQCD